MPTERIIENSVQKSKDGSQNEENTQHSALGISYSEDEILAEKGFYWREKDNVRVLVCRPLEENGFINGFSTRGGGVSRFPENSLNLSGMDIDTPENVAENRRRFLRTLIGEGDNFQISTVWQIHSDKVKIVSKSSDIESRDDEKFDALVSNLSRVLTGVKTADCVPVLIGDTRAKCFAAIHAGWRGTAQSIVVKTIEKMREIYGSNPQDFICAVGPAAVCRYEVGQDVIDAFGSNFSNSTHLFTPTRDHHAFVDLHRANFEQLASTGVSPQNIYIAPFCTLERTDLFFSYRKERKIYGKTGRLLSVIGKRA